MTAVSLAKVFAAATLLAGTPAFVSAQDLHCDRGDVEVRGVDFVGNKTFTDAELANVIVTTPSAWARRVLNLPLSARRCLDPVAFSDDRLRLLIYYRRRGFPEVTIDTSRAQSGLGGVRVRFAVREGRPATLGALVIAGLDSFARRPAVLRDLPIRVGRRFDRTVIDAAMDTIVRRLRNRGYASAEANNTFVTRQGPAGQIVDDSMTITPGPRTRVGAVTVEVGPVPGRARQVPEPIVRRIAGLDSGEVLREQTLGDAQYALYQTDMFAHVLVAADSARGYRAGADSVVPARVAVVENTTHAARVGAGYGTLDCFRVNAELNDYNFAHRARRLDLQARVSKIGIGKPLAGAGALCPDARRDIYSDSLRLNYYLGATLRQPFFFGTRAVPTVTAYTSRVSEFNAYIRTTLVGGVASLAWQRSRRTLATLSYSMDYGRTLANDALFCAVFNLCTPEDRAPVQQNQRLGVVALVVARNGANNTVSPSRGSVTRLEVRHASPTVLSDAALQFNTVVGEASRYFPAGGGNVLALHVRSGLVFGRGLGPSTGFIPPQERMYAGGPTSVRGFPQNELGGATYLARPGDFGIRVDTTDAVVDTVLVPPVDGLSAYRRVVPVGGNSLLVANAEMRLRSPVLPDVLQFAAFADAGDVWNRGRGATLQRFKLKVTPGVQAAALTPVGPVRLIVGYNPYQRPPGPMYYENARELAGQLPCVSGAGIPDPRAPEKTVFPVASSPSCPATFRPAERKSFRSHLTLGLAIGQAF